MVRIEIRPESQEKGICDFCSDPNIYASLPCETFVSDDPILVDSGFEVSSNAHWGACRECDRLVKAEDWDGLLNRSVDRFVGAYGTLIPGLREFIRRLHKQFRDHRKMEA